METFDAGKKLRQTPRHAGNVTRYHAWPTHQTQTNADHTFHVIRIYLELFGPPRDHVLEYMVNHDLGELYSGDTPFPAKRIVPGLKEAHDKAEEQGLALLGLSLPAGLTKMDLHMIKVCDMLEMREFATTEVKMGNGYAEAIITNIDYYMDKMFKGDAADTYTRQKCYDYIKERMY